MGWDHWPSWPFNAIMGLSLDSDHATHQPDIPINQLDIQGKESNEQSQTMRDVSTRALQHCNTVLLCRMSKMQFEVGGRNT
jgi:hypothetical protein